MSKALSKFGGAVIICLSAVFLLAANSFAQTPTPTPTATPKPRDAACVLECRAGEKCASWCKRPSGLPEKDPTDEQIEEWAENFVDHDEEINLCAVAYFVIDGSVKPKFIKCDHQGEASVKDANLEAIVNANFSDKAKKELLGLNGLFEKGGYKGLPDDVVEYLKESLK